VSTVDAFRAWELPGATPRPRRRPGRILLLIVGVALVWKVVVGTLLATLLGFDLDAVTVGGDAALVVADAVPDDPALDELRKDVGGLAATLAKQAPRGRYIVIDRRNNRLWVRTAAEVLHEAVVSTGSGTLLKESTGRKRSWTFDTPTGRLKVLSMRRNPVWVKPDWAFLEEGEEPPQSISERVEKGSLGEWALDLGDGYMIHGTLYERLLGRSITHGCIRVGRDDLREVARLAHPGTPVVIF